jgi:hypothetical protein
MITIDNLALACYIPQPKEAIDEKNSDEATYAFTYLDYPGDGPASRGGPVTR